MTYIGMCFWYENSIVIKNIPKVKYSAVCHLMHISDITWFLDNGDFHVTIFKTPCPCYCFALFCRYILPLSPCRAVITLPCCLVAW